MNQAATPTSAAPTGSHLIHASGHVDFLPSLDNTRRFWPVYQHQIDDTPPSNWVGHLMDGARCTASLKPHLFDADYQIYADNNGDVHTTVARHDHRKKPGAYQVYIIKNTSGHTWHTWLRAVADDFGWLVEVPTC
ncbi:hypothetical protein [Comamonas aquatica]|uniref:Uncharacterized protein n=1 Tax=Comamonas aquatica TaxID=225991 RepID=A0AA42HQK8_9BURK|nr:hypothetical protein [Comamonas aquatica]MDH0362814.1 hypothetical protein [Comamonas aquatica]